MKPTGWKSCGLADTSRVSRKTVKELREKVIPPLEAQYTRRNRRSWKSFKTEVEEVRNQLYHPCLWVDADLLV